MRPIAYCGLLIYVESFEEPPSVWWPKARIEHPQTGETAPVAIPQHQYTEADAARSAIYEAMRRIRSQTWRN
jgi:hypothetical protein